MDAHRPHVLRALKGAWLGAILMAQAALKLFHGFVFVFAHLVQHLFLNDAEPVNAMPHEHRAKHRDVRTGHEHF